MNAIAAKMVIDWIGDGAEQFKITCDGHGSFSAELHSKETAMKIKERLDTHHIMDYPIEMLERPFFYRLH